MNIQYLQRFAHVNMFVSNLCTSGYILAYTFFFILKMSVLQALATVRLCRPRSVASLRSVRQAWFFGHPTIDPRWSKFGVSGFQFSALVSAFSGVALIADCEGLGGPGSLVKTCHNYMV